MQLINLTSEPITCELCGEFKQIIQLYPTSRPACIERATYNATIEHHDGLPEIHTIDVFNVLKLPKPKTDTYFIVSAEVFRHVRHRPDVITPALSRDGIVYMFIAATEGA